MRWPGTGVLDARRATERSDESPDEIRLRLVALPAALAVAALFSRSQPGHALQRLLFGMPLHELGHALTALLLGFPAFPLPWFTPMAEDRSPALLGLLLGATGMLAWLGARTGRRAWVLGGAGRGAAVLLARLVPLPEARALVAFAGDAGAMVLGTLLMCTLFSSEGSPFRRGALRWGLLVIGAAAFSDVASTWWAARLDPGEIPLGRMEGAGLSDASVLVERYAWTEAALVERHLRVAAACLAALAWLWVARAVRPALRDRA